MITAVDGIKIRALFALALLEEYVVLTKVSNSCFVDDNSTQIFSANPIMSFLTLGVFTLATLVRNVLKRAGSSILIRLFSL